MTRDNLEIVLAERPTTDIVPGRTFTQKLGKAPTPADLQDGQILVETLYLSLDPAMRGWLRGKLPLLYSPNHRQLTQCLRYAILPPSCSNW
jgi:NADPH-dependent curcumin reductase CurA